MVGFVDTAVIIDILRGYSPATEWIKHQTHLGICPLVYMELMKGAKNKQKQKTAKQFLAYYELVHLTSQDFEWAMQYHAIYSLSHGVGIIDTLIASVNARLKLPLYTHNLKHFTPLLGDLAQKPY